MPRKWLIDGYNLMYLVPQLKFEMEESFTQAMNHLITSLGEFAVRRKASITIVFDGSPPEGPDSVRRARSVDVRFVGSGQKADPVIRQRIAAEKDAGSLVVVSADREITDYARVCGAQVEHPTEFSRRLLDRTDRANGELLNKYEKTLSKREIQEWLDLFERSGGDEV